MILCPYNFLWVAILNFGPLNIIIVYGISFQYTKITITSNY